MALTAVPAEGLAFADEPAASADAAQQAGTQTDAAGDTAASQEGEESPSSEAVPDRVSEEVALGQTVPAASGADAGEQPSSAGAAAASDVDITRVNVKLNGQDAAAVFAYAGLTFAVNADDPETVACVGVADTAAAGELEIPAAVTWGNTTYTVTNISSRQELRGGGPRLAAIPLR